MNQIQIFLYKCNVNLSTQFVFILVGLSYINGVKEIFEKNNVKTKEQMLQLYKSKKISVEDKNNREKFFLENILFFLREK